MIISSNLKKDETVRNPAISNSLRHRATSAFQSFENDGLGDFVTVNVQMHAVV